MDVQVVSYASLQAPCFQLIKGKLMRNKKLNDEEFLQSAKNFIQKDNEQLRKQNKVYLIFSFVSLLLAVLAVIALMCLTPLKKVEPYLIRVDNSTGKTDVITTLPKVQESYDRAVDNHFLSQYIIYRESYDWENISDYYAATKLMSNDIVKENYIKLYGKGNVNSPVNMLKNQYHIVVKINSISYIGKTAQVRFTKTKIPVVASMEEELKEYRYLATINYQYENKDMTSTQRMVNPLGFTVTSYEISNDDI